MTSQPKDLLLVEDSPADVELTRSALEDMSFDGTLHVTKDGEDALAFLRREGPHRRAPRPALVLLDLNLPRLDGAGVLREIRRDPELAHLPVVVMSSSDTPQDVNRGYLLGSNSYVCKPVDLDEYFETVKAIVDFWLRAAKLPS